MSTKTMVTLPDGTIVPLNNLTTSLVASCDGCGSTAGPYGHLIPAEIAIRPGTDNDGEGTTVAAHLCGRVACQLSEMARRFEAIWPLPEVDHA